MDCTGDMYPARHIGMRESAPLHHGEERGGRLRKGDQWRCWMAAYAAATVLADFDRPLRTNVATLHRGDYIPLFLDSGAVVRDVKMVISRRRRPWLRLFVLRLSASALAAIDYHGRLCNATLSSANGTGTVSFGVANFLTAQLPNGSYNATVGRPLPDPSWLVTVAPDASAPATEFWLDIAGQTYWDDAQTQFDACAFFIRGQIPLETMERAQSDSGDGHTMLGLECRQALTEGVSLAAQKWTQKAASSQSSALVSDICAGIAQSLARHSSDGHSFPQACSQDFGYDNDWSGPTNTYLPLTGRYRNETSLNPHCSMSGPIGKGYYNLAGFAEPSIYDAAARIVTPILTVFFASPNANPAAQLYHSPSQISCLRITSFSSGSKAAPPLAPTSVPPADPSFANRPTKGLSLGAVLALCLCCIGLAGFLIGLSAFLKWWRTNWRRIDIVDERILMEYRLERMGKRTTETPTSKGKKIELEERNPEEVDGTQIVEAASGTGPVELDSTERRPSFVSSRRSLQSFDTCESIAGATTADVAPPAPLPVDRR